MKYNYINRDYMKFLKKKKIFFFKNINHISFFFLKKTIFIRKGIFFRKLIINQFLIGHNAGNFITSRKPFSRLFLKKRR